MKTMKILVHAHVYYTHMWGQLQQYISHIDPYDYDLYVTLVQDNPALKQTILQFNPRAHVQVVENRGYDVGPFITVLNQVDLARYDYFVKMHTKRDLCMAENYHEKFDIRGPKWRDFLLHFISTPQRFKKQIEAFEKDPQLGMLSYYKVITRGSGHDELAYQNALDLLKACGLPSVHFAYVAGTMFIMRAALLKPLQHRFTIADFPPPQDKKPSQLAHTLERFFGALVAAQGYALGDCSNSPLKVKLIRKWMPLFRHIYKNTITTSNYHTIRICKIPIYRKKLKEAKNDPRA